jgi:hypothetical protein
MSKKYSKIALLLACLCGLVAVVLLKSVVKIESNASEGDSALKKKPPHSGEGFGGVNNIAHPAGAKAAMQGEGLAFADILIPRSNVGHAIPSLNRPNVINHWGHYVHDEHRSPYASHLYDQPRENLEEQQQAFLKKMQKIRDEWGAWEFSDPKENLDRPEADFSSAKYKDLPLAEFPPEAWQTDELYVAAFLEQGRGLVNRMREGIYAEYGWSLRQPDGTELDEEAKLKRDEAWKIHLLQPGDDDENIKTGIAQLSQTAMDGLVRKLLHAMMTHDEFYAVLGGHSAAAGVSLLYCLLEIECLLLLLLLLLL